MEDEMPSLAQAEEQFITAREEAEKVAKDLFKGIAERAKVQWAEADDQQVSQLVATLLEAMRAFHLRALVIAHDETTKKFKAR